MVLHISCELETDFDPPKDGLEYLHDNTVYICIY